jgi:hypothetical protein
MDDREAQNYAGMKHDAGKIRMSLIPGITLVHIAAVLEVGARRYTANNWMKLDPQRVQDALQRHFTQRFVHGLATDSDDGLLHTAHMCCCAIFLLWMDLAGLISVRKSVKSRRNVEVDVDEMTISIGEKDA